MNNVHYGHVPKRDGYILLTTLLIIAMVCMLTVGLARYSMNVANAANGSRKALQEKWGAASCQSFALSNQSKLLNDRIWDADTESWLLRSVARSQASVILGDLHFHLRLDDESAKLNLNRIYESSGRQKTIQLARKFSSTGTLKIQLRPLKERDQRGPIEDALESWGQVFELTPGQVLRNELAEATNQLTCWGSGLNYKTADEAVIAETCKPLVGRILTRELTQILSSEDAADWQKALTAAGANTEQIQELVRILNPTSDCQSIWVELKEDGRRRNWLAVREQVAGLMYRVHSFSW